ncbi:HesA/MoeB/ThiF family protein [Haliangium sp.]|uniref:HesA/MoeB/ThiF family protein n=1 Tax=Haliangium sp. TaxID=2663208 RepID=UPI003D0D03E2
MRRELNDNERQRYHRQLRLDGFGEAGQQRLKSTSVLISRAGGVGGNTAVALAMAGVGRLTLAHGGTLHWEHLNRWAWATPNDVGRVPSEVLGEHIRRINPEVEVVTVAENATEENVAKLVADNDAIVDGAPIFEERYLLHREAVLQKKPAVMGAMFSNEGYVTTYLPDAGPCLKCIYPNKPDYWTDHTVFPAIAPGPLTVASISAMEAIKAVTGYGKPLVGVLWYFDIETMVTRKFKVHRRPDCEVCGG